ncbi:MAG: CHASE3 domain-containing protein [Shimia sp.]
MTAPAETPAISAPPRAARSTRVPSRVLIAILCLVLGGIGLALFQSVAAERGARQQVALTTEVLRHLRTSLRMGLNAETGQRGFLLTGDPFYLADYETGERQWLASIDDLDRTLAEVATAEQAAAIERMRTLATDKLAELAETIRLARADDLDGALALVRSDEGKDLMDRFRAEVAALEDEEQAILTAALTRAEVIEARTLPILAMLTAAVVGLVVMGLWLERRTATAEARAREADELRLARERSDLLARELNHRVKNLFSVILSIVSMSGRGASEEVRRTVASLRERIHALSLAHAVSQGQLDREIIGLGELLTSTLAPYRGGEGADGRLTLDGPPVEVPVKEVTPLGLVMHELATNAAKYGALSVPEGSVVVRWEQLAPGEAPPDAGDGPALRLTWTERGGPAAEEPGHEGFGSIMLRQAARQLRGTVERRWTADGLEAELVLPLPRSAEVADTTRGRDA